MVLRMVVRDGVTPRAALVRRALVLDVRGDPGYAMHRTMRQVTERVLVRHCRQ
jgi:hypothetical protein